MVDSTSDNNQRRLNDLVTYWKNHRDYALQHARVLRSLGNTELSSTWVRLARQDNHSMLVWLQASRRLTTAPLKNNTVIQPQQIQAQQLLLQKSAERKHSPAERRPRAFRPLHSLTRLLRPLYEWVFASDEIGPSSEAYRPRG